MRVSSEMEPSQIIGVTEECHSSESGWTMYIGSPVNSSNDDEIYTDIADYNNGGEDEQDYDHTDAINDDESYDSMASDASSGPSNQGHILALFDRKKKPLMEKKKQKKEETKLKKKKKNKEEEDVREDQSVFTEKKGRASSVQSSGKVKKTFWVAKTKDN